MTESKVETFHPVAFFGFSIDANGNSIPCQMWMDSWGNFEFRPLQVMQMKETRRSAIAGYLSDDDDD